jgi:hypothetical protein
VGNGPNAVVAADVNGDGKVDLISANWGNGGSGNTLTVLTNNGSGGFGSNATYIVGNGPSFLVAADVNGDGKVDLISANTQSNSLTVLTNNGSGGFVLATTVPVGNGPFGVTAADVNGDGRLDLISANRLASTLTVVTNSSTFLPRLTIKYSGNSVIVSWPSPWTGWAGWMLQQNTNLNTTNWMNFSDTIGDDGAIRSVTNSSPTDNLFFRLAHP